jgi:hypothetical protein
LSKKCGDCQKLSADDVTQCEHCSSTNFYREHVVAGRRKKQNIRAGVTTLVGGLTEAITNSDKSHQDLIRFGYKYEEEPFIKIEIWKKDDIVQVTDNAAGFCAKYDEDTKQFTFAESAEDGIEGFARYGEEKAVHTEKARNLFGAGLSDTILQDEDKREGRITWKKPGGDTCSFTFKPVGEQDYLLADQSPDDETKKQVSDHGTCITFFWKRNRKPIPDADDLREKIETWYELKNILNPKRKNRVKIEIVYHDRRGNTTTINNLKHSYYKFEKKDLIKDIENETVNFERDSFKIIKANMKVVPDGTELEIESDREKRTGGLYIEDENGNVFDLTLFGQGGKAYSRRIIGTVVLTSDFKRLVQEEMKNGEYPLKVNRTGFDFSHPLAQKLRRALKKWLEEGLNKLKNESGSSATNDMGDANKEIDKLMRAITEDIGGAGTEIPESLDQAIQFSQNSYDVLDGLVPKRVRVFIDTKKIQPRQTIDLELTNNANQVPGSGGGAVSATSSDFFLDQDSFKVPDPDPDSDIAFYDIEVTCARVTAEDDLTANWDDKESDSAHLTCVAKVTPPALSGECLFWEQNMKNRKTKFIKEDTLGTITLFADSKIVSKIDSVDFILEASEELEEDVSDTFVLNDQAIATTSDKKKMEFQMASSKFTQDTNGYHSLSIQFTPKKKGITCTLTATINTNAPCDHPLHQGVVPADCFASTDQTFRQVTIKISKPTGSFRGWKAEQIPAQQSYIYEPDDNLVIFNLNFPHNKSILGDTNDIAKSRAEDSRSVRMHVANGVLEAVIEHFLVDEFAKGKKQFLQSIQDAQGNVEFRPAMQKFLTTKHHSYYRTYSLPIYRAYVKNLDFATRQTLKMQIEFDIPENAVEVVLKKSEPVEKKFNNLTNQMWKGKKGTLTVYETFVQGTSFKIGVWKPNDESTYYIKMHDAMEPMEQNKTQEMLFSLKDVEQIYEPTTKGSHPEGTVFTRCVIGALNTANNSLSKEDLLKIPDPPSIGETTITEHKNWINQETQEPYIRYDERKNVTSCPDSDPSRDKLVSIVEDGNTGIMAANFVRTVVLPMVQNTLDFSKKK